MILKPQDLLLLLKLVALGDKSWSYNRLAVELAMSPSEVHGAAKRVLAARLAVRIGDVIRPNISNLEEFLLHGMQYVFAPDRGELTRGVPTAHAAPPLDGVVVPDDEPPPVWPDPEGGMRGMAFSPLYKSAPKAAQNDPILYELLVLVDGLRGGQARERELARQELRKRLEDYGKEAESES
jgi:hypothetical protein